MKKIPLSTHLAILQQAEYDFELYREWNRAKHVLPVEILSELQPEKKTLKLKLVEGLSRFFSMSMQTPSAIGLSLSLLAPAEHISRSLLLWKAVKHLRALQEKGLVVIGIAGSYGKTSVKHQLHHLLSVHHFTHMSPASYNTPLGLAQSILSLTSDHDIFLAEMGEYQSGDIHTLLELLRPDIGVLTPVGFAHSERFGSTHNMVQTFAELWQSPYAPECILIDDTNDHLFKEIPNNVFWYGKKKTSHLYASNESFSLLGGKATLHFSDQTKTPVKTNLINATQLTNALPALLLQQMFQQPMEPLVRALQYVPATPRRMELHFNTNGSVVIDNSYNTNPGSWAANQPLLQELSTKNLVVFTPGFVELSSEENTQAHQQLAADLQALGAMVGVIRTRFNSELIDTLQKKLSKEKLLLGNSYQDLLQQLSTHSLTIQYLWMEGGVREMYQ